MVSDKLGESWFRHILIQTHSKVVIMPPRSGFGPPTRTKTDHPVSSWMAFAYAATVRGILLMPLCHSQPVSKSATITGESELTVGIVQATPRCSLALDSPLSSS